MTKEEINFIIETLEDAISWADYADPYFQIKHNLLRDQRNVTNAIILLKEAFHE